MQSAENGFKKHHLIPFSQKIQGVVAASLTSSWRRKTVKHHPLCAGRKTFRFMYPPRRRSKLWQTMKFFRKRKWTRNRLKCLRLHHLHPFFRKKSRGGPQTSPSSVCSYIGIFPNAPTTLHRSNVGLQPPSVSGFSFWIRHWRCNVYF